MASWAEKLSPQLGSELSRSGHYDWHIFTLANALVPPIPDLRSFLDGCHVGVASASDCGDADLAYLLSPRQIEEVVSVFALLTSGVVERAKIVFLAVRLTDPLVGTRPRHTVVAELLARALGRDVAIAELKTHTTPDRHSREISEYLLLRLLIEAGRYDEAEIRLEKLLGGQRWYPAVGHAFAADLARRRNNPADALRNALTARNIDPHLPEVYEPLVWALSKTGRLDEAELAIAEAGRSFADDRFTRRLAMAVAGSSAGAVARGNARL